MKLLLLSIFLLVTFTSADNTQTTFLGEEIKVVGNVIDLTNTHRRTGVLRFSVSGVNVTKITHTDGFWTFDLSDHTVMKLQRYHPFMATSTEYRFSWPGAGPSLDREICFHYGHNDAHWFQTYEERSQKWPMDTNATVPKGFSFTTQDYGRTKHFGSIIEYLFLNSDGFIVVLDEYAPWFLRRDPKFGEENVPALCLAVNARPPYSLEPHYEKEENTLGFHILNGRNLKVAYDNMIMHYTDWIWKPFHAPDPEVFTHPVWSTWAEYHGEVNQQKVLEFATNIKKHNLKAAHIEIDDRWEAHFGDLTFDTKKFPNATKMIADLKSMGFNISLWVYPFVNRDSAAFEEGKKYFTVDKANHSQPGLVSWWHSNSSAGIVDFSHYQSSEWFIGRLYNAKHHLGIKSFKFDAGESSWYESNHTLFNSTFTRRVPNYITKEYVKAAARLGNSVEVRSGFKSQDQVVFTRLFDRDSNWSFEGGLRSLITTALTMSLAGYSFILPDMIGGNDRPSEELYIRWLQATTFLPAMQFSVPPWSFPNNTEKVVNLTRHFIDLHAEHSPTIVALAKEVSFGHPIIRPMWFAEPENLTTYTIDDQFMLGSEMVVAPVLVNGQRERSVYLPPGSWTDQAGKQYTGPGLFKVLAPLEILPYFKKVHH